jgi:hypothetical protein
MEVAIPSIIENGAAYLDWRPLSRDQMMEEHVRAICAAVRCPKRFEDKLLGWN